MDTIRRKIIGVDIDETLCNEVCFTPDEITKSTPRPEVIERVNELYRHNFIVIYTARRDDLIETTLQWLKIHGVKYHAISNIKIPLDYLIDSNTIQI